MFTSVSFTLLVQAGANDSKLGHSTKRWNSGLATRRSTLFDSTAKFNLSNGLLVTRRYESTAAASTSADSPAEKYEYQAEVRPLNLLMILLHKLVLWLFISFLVRLLMEQLYNNFFDRLVVSWTSLYTAYTVTKKYFFGSSLGTFPPIQFQISSVLLRYS